MNFFWLCVCVIFPTPQEFDALIIPGGFAPDYWRRDKRFVDLVTEMYKLGAAI